MIENTDGVKWALNALRANSEVHAVTSRYYNGDHRLTFATEKFRNAFGRLFQELSINLCPVCVDVPSDRLQIDGFGVVKKGEQSPVGKLVEAAQKQVEKSSAPDALKKMATGAIEVLRRFLVAVGLAINYDPVEESITEIWRRNRMAKRAGEVHSEALKTGDAYVIVDWYGKDDDGKTTEGIATIHPNAAGRCAVKYDAENPGYVVQAAKWWHEEDGKKFRIRLNLYYLDRIEKYTTKARTNSALPD